MEEKFITPIGVRELTGMTLAALAQLRHRGQGPRFYKPTARTVLYRRSEVIAWVERTAHVDSKQYA
jgi:predicted DNA-binding transcriptional regulator AlpA